MPRAADYVPRLCVHKATGRAYVKLDGQVHYCGRAGSAEATARYQRLVGEWLRAKPAPDRGVLREHPPVAGGITVAELAELFRQGLRAGLSGKFRRRVASVTRDLEQFAGTMAASGFGPRKLRDLRQRWVDRGLARGTANTYTRLVVQVWRWGAAEELVPVEAWTALRALAGLRRGEGGQERDSVGPVDPKALEAVLGLVARPVGGLLRLMRVTGMRPGEARVIRPAEIDRSGEVWVYRPAAHKTARLGKERPIAIGPRGQEVLRPFLEGLTPHQYVFRPWNRQKPYSATAIQTAVAKACLKAGVPRWHPHQIRHLWASEVRARFGLEAAQVSLGHAHAQTSELYAQRDLKLAEQVAREIG